MLQDYHLHSMSNITVYRANCINTQTPKIYCYYAVLSQFMPLETNMLYYHAKAILFVTCTSLNLVIPAPLKALIKGSS